MTNFPATLAAVTARGPVCDDCGAWTYRPDYLALPQAVSRLCPQCLPVSAEHRQDDRAAAEEGGGA